jgi:hypothetical protein
MTISYSKFFDPVVLGTSASTLYAMAATPATSLLRGGRVRLTNTTAGPVTVTLHAVPAAGVAGANNAFVSAKSIGANDYLDVDVPILPAGATLQGLAGAAASITAHMLSGSLFS